uniref:Retrovirus-related Pol polyprotein from transposon 17.6 n=1 Tax=Cajanus cajan TaxID=3821 RepID=A0A151U5U6_CAJCA|nr:Retrovirus-related Pol polyprotein from transposon 17.6 [Cajanus cajan]
MVVKSADTPSHVTDLAEVFHALRRHQMRLNPDKCVFGVSGGKFLGFMLSSRGIEANPDKCQAIIDMRSPSNLKEVQKLAGRLTALSRFLPSSFQLFKKRLGTPPVLTKPTPSLEVVLYLAVSGEAISAGLIQEQDDQQQPIYFISRVLQDVERRYQLLEKVALGLIYAARHLRQYFQSHTVVVRTDCPIAKVLRKPELAGRMMAWSIKLSEFDIHFEPRGAIKAQSLADFINELSPLGHFEDNAWTMHVDGSSNQQGSGASIILESPSGITLEQSLRFSFKTSNNQAEYEALLAGMRLAAEMGATKIVC